MKHFSVLSLALIAACFAGIALGYNATFGRIGPQDIRTHIEFTYKSSKPWLVVSEDRFYPPKNGSVSTVGQCTITGIRVIDQIPNGKGGYATLRQGGPGFRNATLHFKSQRGAGYDFMWEVFCNRFL